MPFDPQVFDPDIFGSVSSATCLFDKAIFDGAVFDACVDAEPERVVFVGAGVDAKTWQEAVQDRFDKLHTKLKADVKEQTKVVRKIAAVKKKLAKAERPEGILANLHLLEQRRQELRREIKDLRLQVQWVNIEIQDEDDEELLLLH